MAFAAGQKVTAAQLNKAAPTGEAQSAVNTVFGSTSSTSYTSTLTGTTAVTLAYVAPPSGAIAVTFTASIAPQASGRYGVVSVDLSGAAGVVAASDSWQAFAKSTNTTVNDQTVERTKVFTGLTPGAAGVITMDYKVIGGAVNFNDRQLKWRPVAA